MSVPHCLPAPRHLVPTEELQFHMELETQSAPVTPVFPRLGLSSLKRSAPSSGSSLSLSDSSLSEDSDYYNIGPLHRFQRNRYRSRYNPHQGASILSSSYHSGHILSTTSSVSYIQDTTLHSFNRPGLHPRTPFPSEANIYTLKGLSALKPHWSSSEWSSSSLSSVGPLNSGVLEESDDGLGPRPACVGQDFTPYVVPPQPRTCVHQKVQSWLDTKCLNSQPVQGRRRHPASPSLHPKLPSASVCLPQDSLPSGCWRGCDANLSHDLTLDRTSTLMDSEATTFMEAPLTRSQPVPIATKGGNVLTRKLRSVRRKLQKLRRPSDKAGF